MLQNGLRVAAGLSVGSLTYNRARQLAVYQRLLSGHCPRAWPLASSSAIYIPRPDEEAALARILDPTQARESSMFFYILGSAGCGKTTCVQTVCNRVCLDRDAGSNSPLRATGAVVQLSIGNSRLRPMVVEAQIEEQTIWQHYLQVHAGSSSSHTNAPEGGIVHGVRNAFCASYACTSTTGH